MIYPTYIRFFSIELMIDNADYSEFTYEKDSETSRRIQIGKILFLINYYTLYSSNKIIWERFNKPETSL